MPPPSPVVVCPFTIPDPGRVDRGADLGFYRIVGPVNAGWGFCGICFLVGGLIIDPLATAFGAAGGVILLLARINYTMGPIVQMTIGVVRAFVFHHDDLIERLQKLSIAVIKWRKI